MKQCTKCKSGKEIFEFYKKTSSWCKECYNSQKRAFYKENKARLIDVSKGYYLANKEEVLEKKKIHHSINKENQNKKCQEYYQKHRDELIKKNIQYELERRKVDPAYRARKNLRKRVRDAIKEKGFSKRTEKILGLNQTEFKEYIESKFTEGMTWENYGYRGWHIDHSKALSTASTIEEMEALCHYTNLAPMWGIENMKKGNRP
jgi:hypothetical protein